MRLLSRVALLSLAVGFALTLDLDKTLRTGQWTLNTASAKKHHHKRHHRKHRKHHRARHRKHHDKQTEM